MYGMKIPKEINAMEQKWLKQNIEYLYQTESDKKAGTRWAFNSESNSLITSFT